MGLIYLGSCLLIYLVERHPTLCEPVAVAMANAGDSRFGVSPLVKCECLVGVLKRGDAVLRQAYTGLFAQLVGLDMPEQVYLRAAELQARFGVRTPDALHVACAEHHRCDALWTNDDRLGQAAAGLVRRISAD